MYEGKSNVSFTVFKALNIFKWLIYVATTFHPNIKAQEKIVPSQMISCRWFHHYILVSHTINFPGNKAPMLLAAPPPPPHPLHTCSCV